MHGLDEIKKLNLEATFGPCDTPARQALIDDAEKREAEVQAEVGRKYAERREAERQAGLREWETFVEDNTNIPWGPYSDWPRVNPVAPTEKDN